MSVSERSESRAGELEVRGRKICYVDAFGNEQCLYFEDVLNEISSIKTDIEELDGEIESSQDDDVMFDVSITSTNSPVREDEELVVGFDVENVGSESGTKNIRLTTQPSGGSDESKKDDVSVSLDPGEVSSESLSWSTSVGDADDYTARIRSPNSVDDRSVSVLAIAGFSVSITSTNSPIDKGQTLDVDVDVTNNGSNTDIQTIDLEIDDGVGVVYSYDVEVASGATESIQLNWRDADTGSYTVTASSPSDSDTVDVDVVPLSGAYFAVDIISTNSPVNPGDVLDVNYEAENIGPDSGTRDIALFFGIGEKDRNTDITLSSGSVTSGVLSWDSTGATNGSYDAQVRTGDDRDAEEIVVGSPAAFDVSITSTNSPIDEKQTLFVDYEVTNSGENEDTQTIELTVDSTVRDSESQTISPSNTATGTLSWETTSGDAGDYTAQVSSNNGSDSSSVTVNSIGDFQVTIDNYEGIDASNREGTDNVRTRIRDWEEQ